MMMLAAIITPAVVSPRMTSSAPTPRMPICSISRVLLAQAATSAARSLATPCRPMPKSCRWRQTRLSAGSMPMARTASALRAASSAKRAPAAISWPASARGARVARSFHRPSRKSTTPPANATWPSQGCSR